MTEKVKSRRGIFVLCALLFLFLVSCSSTQRVNKERLTPAPKSQKDFLSEIKKIQKENKVEISESQRKEYAKGNVAVVEEIKESAKIKKRAELPKNETTVSHKLPPASNKKVITVVAATPSTIIEEVAIADDPANGIIVDESVVDEFEENYKPIAEKDGFKETEENIIREEMKDEIAPYITMEEAIEIEDKLAQKEFEALKILREVKDLDELEVLQESGKLDVAIEEEKVIYDVPVVVNNKVEYFIKYFKSRKMRKIFNKWLCRSTKYLPMMRKIFEEKGLPQDLTYLAMIESGFNTYAYSRARACGPWQFIRSTGKNYGLRIDHWVDERRDPEKATIAAANYLSDLQDMFGSWYLAMAAYNAGEGKMSRAIKRHKTEDFWELSKYRYLRRETKNYVPKYLAATLIAKNPEKYGFGPVEAQPLYEYDTVEIKEPTDLDVIARAAGVTLSAIKNLNPELRRWYTPPERDVYILKIPKNTKDRFLSKYSKLKPSERISFLTYRIKHGETLSHVARRFGTSVSAIMKANKIRSARYVRAGVELTLPIRGGTKVASYRKSYTSKLERAQMILVPKGETVTYKVKRGDTLWDIAQRSGVRVQDIIRLNNTKSSKIYPGKEILLYKEPQKIYKAKKSKAKTVVASKSDGDYYRVRRGDSLWSISKKFNVPLKTLKKMNNISRRSIIKPGQKILVAYKNKDKAKDNIQLASVKEYTKSTYRVRKGDTLWDIAKRHNTAISKIKRLNNLRSNKIKPGDELIIK